MGVVVPLDKAREPSQSLAPLLELVDEDMNAINRIILDKAVSDVELIPELTHHLVNSGGKRLRPMLAIAASKLCGYQGTGHVRTAAAIEFMHTATLLHDDVVDESDPRRGRKTAHLIWGNQATVLVGDFLFSRAFELMVEDGSLRVLKILSNASAVIAQGEVDQLMVARQIETSEEKYLQVITAKTAVLFAAACQIAAVVAERDEACEAALESYGRNLGIAFQLVDDAIDYMSDAETMGKGQGDDFREGKLTLPVILAYRRGGDEERQFWRDAMEGRRKSDADLAEAIERLKTSGSIADTLARARHYGELAIDAIADMPASSAKTALTETVRFAIARAF